MQLERLPDELRKNRDVLSATGLSLLFKTPKHFHSQVILKEKEPTKAMQVGTLIHKVVLEPDNFHQYYVVLDDQKDYLVTVDQLKAKIESLGEKPCKGKKEDLINQLLTLDHNAKIWDRYIQAIRDTGLEEVSHEQMKKCERVSEEVKKHKFLSKALNGGMIEQSAWWEHETGVLISMRMDFYHPSMGGKRPVIIDLKKARSADPRYFEKQIWENKLFIQAAVYVDGIKKITGVEPLYCWAVVEDEAPYCIEVFAADFGMIEAGRAVYNKMILKYLECKNNNQWPGYTNGNVTNISLPSWAFEKLDQYAEEEISE